MDKLKSILRPGGQQEDEILYGSGSGNTTQASTSHTASSSIDPAGTGSSDASGLQTQQQGSDSAGVARKEVPSSTQHTVSSPDNTTSTLTGHQTSSHTGGFDQQQHTNPSALHSDRGVPSQGLSHNTQYNQGHSGQTSTSGLSHNAASLGTNPAHTSDNSSNAGAIGNTHNQQSGLRDSTFSGSATGTSHATGSILPGVGSSTSSQLPGTTGGYQSGSSALPSSTSAGVDPTSTGLSHHVHNGMGSSHSHSGAALGAASGQHRDHHHDHDTALAGGLSGVAASHEARKHHDHGSAEGGLSHHVHNHLYQPGGHSHSHTATGVSTTGTGNTGVSGATGGLGAHNTTQSGSGATSTIERSFPLSSGTGSHSLPDRSVEQNTAGGNHGREGLAAAAGAATAVSGGSHTTHASGTGTGILGGSHTSHTLGTETTTSGGSHTHPQLQHLHSHLGNGHDFKGANIDPEIPTGGPHATVTANLLDPNLDNRSAQAAALGAAGTTQPQHHESTSGSHHTGRDATLASAAGATGAGVYNSAIRGDATGPAPHTIGPHDKDWKNVLDPRVQPDPALMKSDTSSTGVTGGNHTQDQARTAGVSATSSAGTGLGQGHSAHQPTGSTTTTPSTQHSIQDKALPGGAGVAGAGAAGLAASKAFKDHHHHSPVTGEKGLSHSGANPYSSQGVDPRVDGSHRTGGALEHGTLRSGHTGSSTTSGATGQIGAGAVGAHGLNQHHGERIAGEGLGAHDATTHHGVHSGTTGATSASHAAKYDLSDPASAHTGTTGGASGLTTYHGESHSGEKLGHAREKEAQHAHEAHEGKTSLKDKITGLLHRDKKDKNHTESATDPHLHHDDRNRLHKEPHEGVTVGTATQGTYTRGPNDSTSATTTGKELGA